jgi:hypothetical protein
MEQELMKDETNRLSYLGMCLDEKCSPKMANVIKKLFKERNVHVFPKFYNILLSKAQDNSPSEFLKDYYTNLSYLNIARTQLDIPVLDSDKKCADFLVMMKNKFKTNCRDKFDEAIKFFQIKEGDKILNCSKTALFLKNLMKAKGLTITLHDQVVQFFSRMFETLIVDPFEDNLEDNSGDKKENDKKENELELPQDIQSSIIQNLKDTIREENKNKDKEEPVKYPNVQNNKSEKKDNPKETINEQPK